MRTIAISDIHGCYTELKNLIAYLEEEGKYNKNTDKLVFLGDYIERGEDSRLVIKFIRDMQKDNNNVIALMGNHEDMLLHNDVALNEYYDVNGQVATAKSYKGFENQLKDDIKWMNTLPLYHEDDYFIYVHAGVDVNKPIDKQDRDTLLWIREPFIYNAKKYYKRVIFGHTPTFFLNRMYMPVYTDANNIGIDTGCVYDGALTAVLIEDAEVKEFYQVNKEYEEEYVNA